MKEPYRPVALVPEMQGSIDAYYAGVECEIATEDKGYVLRLYVDGKHIGGLQELPEAMKVTG